MKLLSKKGTGNSPKEFVVKQLREDYDQDFSAVISKSLFFSINIANNPCTTELPFTLF